MAKPISGYRLGACTGLIVMLVYLEPVLATMKFFPQIYPLNLVDSGVLAFGYLIIPGLLPSIIAGGLISWAIDRLEGWVSGLKRCC